jgi:DUF2075 family protein
MIVYQSTKKGFLGDVLSGEVEDIIRNRFQLTLKEKAREKEVVSWKNSLQYMNNVLYDTAIPDDAGVSIEIQIPQTSKRIDFVITGCNADKKEHAVIIELKQWTSAELTEKDGVVKTWYGGGFVETSHPSYQAWSYSALLEGYNETVYKDNITLHPCAFLHNYAEDQVITNPFYREHIEKAPVFLKTDAVKLQEFIRQFIRYGDTSKIMYRIDNGKIRPSKMLVDSLVGMIKGNREFVMIDDQKVVFESALLAVKNVSKKNKKVLIVQGGPGTGKSVVAVNLLVAISQMSKVAQYVSKNAAPRAVYESKLTGTLKKTEYSNLFKGSGSFVSSPPDIFDALIVDEAHRLNEKSGLYANLGENQVKEIIRAAKCSVFFLDEDQKVTLKDIGTQAEIEKWARFIGAEVEIYKLQSQFRCSGSDGYLAWLDHKLQIRETANTTLENSDYDFKVVSSPAELRDIIFEKNKEHNKARLVAGYCWDWKSKKNPLANDIVFPEHHFAMKWNLTTDGSLWIQQPNSVNEVGCIHTCLGLEADYIGVIVGSDLIVRAGQVMVDPSKRSRMDRSILGYKSLIKENPEKGHELVRAIIKNTYRTLMTRGMKGCYVYFVDKETEEFFK